LRAVGLSTAKTKYVKSLAQAIEERSLDLEDLRTKSDEEVITELIKIKGIGRWTAEMFLIFTLHRTDVFSVGDLGLRTAVARLYTIDRDNLSEIQKISEQWSPYRSFAARYLWKSLDNEPIQKETSKNTEVSTKRKKNK
jgi:DNA-3-methyladenine glycosylase II